MLEKGTSSGNYFITSPGANTYYDHIVGQLPFIFSEKLTNNYASTLTS